MVKINYNERTVKYLVKRQIKNRRLNSDQKQQLAFQIFLFMLEYDISNQIITQIILNKIKKKLASQDNKSISKYVNCIDENGQQRKSCPYDYYYYDAVAYLIETKFFQTNKHHLTPALLLLYWTWRHSKVRKMKKKLCAKIVYLFHRTTKKLN
eukprot:751965_1